MVYSLSHFVGKSEKVPAGHFEHLVAPTGLMVFIGHGSHSAISDVLNVPALHAENKNDAYFRMFSNVLKRRSKNTNEN